MKFEVKINTADFAKFTAGFPDIIDKMKEAGNTAAGLELVKVMQGVLSTPAARINKSFIGSLPGQSPKMRTGELRNSIYTTKTSSGSIIVGSRAPYARALEYGTSTMAARPFLYRSLNLARTAMRTEALKAMTRVYKAWLNRIK